MKLPFANPPASSILFVYMKIYLYEIHLHTLDYQMHHDCGQKQLKCYSYPMIGRKVFGLDSRNVETSLSRSNWTVLIAEII